MTDSTPAALIAEVLVLEAHIDVQKKKFGEYLRPFNEEVEAKKNMILDMLNKAQCNSFKTENGTAYLSTIVTPSIDGDKTEWLDWVCEDWDKRGAMLQIGAPQKDALQEFMDSNNGALPPQVKTSAFTRVNIRRS